MGVTKSDQFTEENNAFALIFKALGHPARVAIIEHILKANSCICGDIVKELPLAQPTVSQHLKELKNGRLAMIAVAAYLSNYFIPGSVPGIPSIF
jgi:DNA-binding transcriptional ArsR family regulator